MYHSNRQQDADFRKIIESSSVDSDVGYHDYIAINFINGYSIFAICSTAIIVHLRGHDQSRDRSCTLLTVGECARNGSNTHLWSLPGAEEED